MKIEPDLRGKLARLGKPSEFRNPAGRFRGWKVAIPGGHSLASPAVVNGRVFLGGGFASFDFHAFNADDGTLAWEYQTSDDGPTAAVVDDEHVVFNTESCEREALTVDGTPVWKKSLGDPPMSMPAVARGRVYMAYPDSQGDHRHNLACFDLRTGQEYGKQPIAGEVITAPVLAEGHVHFSTLDGTLYRLRQDDGFQEWMEPRNATSSPVVWEGGCYFSQRQEVPGESADAGSVRQMEHLGCPRWGSRPFAITPGPRAKLTTSTVGRPATDEGAELLDSPLTPPAIANGKLFFGSVTGDVHCLSAASGEELWSVRTGEPVVFQPVVAGGKVFIGTDSGSLICIETGDRDDDGWLMWGADAAHNGRID